MSTPWQRARQPEQKASRREAILDAAAARFDAGGYEALSLGAVASDVGLAKSNLYRYFESKEAMCLQLMQDAHDAFLAEVVAALEALPAPSPPDVVGAVLAAHLARNGRLCALAAIASSVLERNVGPERIVAHKTWYLGGGLHLLAALGRVRPELLDADPTRGFRFLRAAYALVMGLWPAANPPAAVAEVLAGQPMLAPLRIDFERDLRDGLVVLLRGLAAEVGDPAPLDARPHGSRP